MAPTQGVDMETNEQQTTMIPPRKTSAITVDEARAGKYKTYIFALYLDQDTNQRNLTQFSDKAAFDEWLEKTNVRVERVFRGVEKKTKQRLVFA